MLVPILGSRKKNTQFQSAPPAISNPPVPRTLTVPLCDLNAKGWWRVDWLMGSTSGFFSVVASSPELCIIPIIYSILRIFLVNHHISTWKKCFLEGCTSPQRCFFQHQNSAPKSTLSSRDRGEKWCQATCLRWLIQVMGEILESFNNTLPETNSSPLKPGRAPKGNQYSNHPFSGSKMLVSGRGSKLPSNLWGLWKLMGNVCRTFDF